MLRYSCPTERVFIRGGNDGEQGKNCGRDGREDNWYRSCGTACRRSQKIIGFEPGKDFLTYSSHEDMLKKIKYVLDNPEKGREIARNGFNKSTKHTFECRARTILAHLLK